MNVKVFSLRNVTVESYESTHVEEGGQDENREGRGEEEEPPQEFRKQRLCCPITRLPLNDPVVCKKDGLSYEKQTLIAREGDRGFYSNRALVEYMKPSTNPRNELQSHNKDKIGIFFCPITCDLFRDPVIDPSSNNYERAAIIDWIQENGISPITRMPLQTSQLHDNTTLFRVLYKEIQQADEEIANLEEVRTWKNDVSNFNYLTNAIKPTTVAGIGAGRSLEEEASARHPARMRVDYDGRWRSRNKDTVTICGLILVGLLFSIFAFLAFPELALYCVGGCVLVVLIFGKYSKQRI